ncbi:MAG: lysylphosphatidylglycerol synthase transmembrane domain-containing protein [Candidatus Limivicinus sp.]
MTVLLFACSIILLMAGHTLRLTRWSSFIKTYEHPPAGALLRSMALGYALNFFVPFKLGDILRAYYSGKRMKNGVGFSLATVILDRFLDVLVVAILFAALALTNVGMASVRESARFYYILAVAVLALLLAANLFSSALKRVALKVCSVFNDRIKLKGERFFWTLINTFRDIKRVNIVGILAETAGMWSFYIGSYALFAAFMQRLGSDYSLVEIILSLFSRASLDLSALTVAASRSARLNEQLWLAAYTLLPSVIMFVATLTKAFTTAEKTSGADDGEYLKILPQLDEKDQLRFLDEYFSANSPQLMRKISELNREVSIVRDCSSGSNASTLLCIDSREMFYRKYAFGADGNKLAQQLDWLVQHSGKLPLCEIIRSVQDSDYCCYDMRYRGDASGMFQYIHSHPIQDGKRVLLSVLECVREKLYVIHVRPADLSHINAYISAKVTDNLNTIMTSRVLAELLKYDTLTINHREYSNLPKLAGMFEPEYLSSVFSGDTYCDIHGDMTIENIICTGNDGGFYLIDPNPGNIHESSFLDYAKLLQSLHGGYEFMVKTSSVSISGNNIDFVYTRSAAYDQLCSFLIAYLEAHFTPQEVKSIFYHELVHWLRLMPYKLRKDARRAPIFYAGLVMAANDVYTRFEKN